MIERLADALRARDEVMVAVGLAGITSDPPASAPQIELGPPESVDTEQKIIADIGLLVASALEDSELLPSILDRLAGYLPFDYGTITRVDWQSREIDVLAYKVSNTAAIYGPPDFVDSQWSVTKGVTGFVATSGTAVILDDVHQDARYIDHRPTDAPELRSELATPLRFKGQVVGVLNLESHRERYFTRRQIEVAALIAPVIGGVVHRATEHRRLVGARESFRGLTQMLRVMLERWDESSLLCEFASRIVSIFALFDVCIIRTVDWQKGWLCLRGFGLRSGADDQFPPTELAELIGHRIEIEHSLIGESVQRRRSFHIRDVRNRQEAFSNMNLVRALNLHGMMVAPIPALDFTRPIGCISVYSRRPDVRFTDDDLAALEDVAAFFSMAVSHSRATLEREARETSWLDCAEGPRCVDCLQRLIESALKLTRATGASVFMVDGERLSLKATTGIFRRRTGERITDFKQVSYRFGEGKTGWVAKHARTMRLVDRQKNDELLTYHGCAEREDFVEADHNIVGKFGFLAVPIVTNGVVVGVIRVVRRGDTLDFNEIDQQLLETCVARYAESMANVSESSASTA